MKNQTRVILLIAFTAIVSSCTRVAPNYVGVLMENYGKAGKSDFKIVKGKVSDWAAGTELFQVPLFEQRAKFENPLKLKAADNTAFSSSPNYSYKVIEARAIDVVFQNKQLESGDAFMKSLEDNILEAKIYDIMKEESRKFVTDSLMANGGSLRFEERVQALVKSEFELRGLELMTFSSQLEFSTKVTEKIDNRNEVNTNISVLDQKIAEQKKRNVLAELQTQENLIKSRGITPEILQQSAIEKWNGVLPSTYSSSNLPFVKAIK